MVWNVKYLPEVHDDLSSLDGASVKRVKTVIENRIINGSPDKSGKPLRKNLASCRRIRVGDIRIIYKIFEKEIQVMVIAIGMRRNNAIYNLAYKRKAKLTIDSGEEAATKKKVKRIRRI